MATDHKDVTPYDPTKVKVADKISIPINIVPVDTRITWKEVMPSERRVDYVHRMQSPTRETRPQPVKPSAGAVKNLLLSAANYFEKGGQWCQGAVGNDTQVCAVGALLRMESGDADNVYNESQPFRHPVTSAAVDKLAGHLAKSDTPPARVWKDIDPNFGWISAWNDTKGRTKDDVVKLFRDAAKE